MRAAGFLPASKRGLVARRAGAGCQPRRVRGRAGWRAASVQQGSQPGLGLAGLSVRPFQPTLPTQQQGEAEGAPRMPPMREWGSHAWLFDG